MKLITVSDLASLTIYEIGQIYRDVLRVYLDVTASGPDRNTAFRSLEAISVATARIT